ncbi:MAG: efflux RND transporter permease subunit, partial [Candidatus Competibacteraceae bacterium]|nr:efflux RND transporter permease subunit [Candidatus Competibacteraceae bacterium]
TRQVAPGVLASFLTTVAVFGPLAFLEGDIGKVLRVIPVVLILVLTVSYVEAFLILPHHLLHSLQHAHSQGTSRFRQRFERGLDTVRQRALGATVDWVIQWRYLFVGLVIALFIVSIGMIASGQLKFRAFPDIEGDTIEARILLPQGTPLWRTERVVERVVDALKRVDDEFSPSQPDEERLVQSINIRFNQNQDANETGPHVATVTADLLNAEVRTGHLDDVLNRWREETGAVPDVISLNYKEPQIGPGGLAIDIRLSGPDLDALKAASLELQNWLGRYQGVFDLSDNLRPGKPELRLRLREGALALGLDASTIAQQLRAAFFGTTAKEIQVGVESYEVDVRLRELDQNSLVDLEDFRVTTADGAQVPLGAVTTLELERGFARIQRIDGLRTVTVQGDVDGRFANASEIVADTRAQFLPELMQRYPSVSVGLEGQSKESATTGSSLMRGFLIGLAGIFILLSFLFRSYLEPIVVMVAIPLSLIGVIWGHLLMGLEVSMPSMMGFVSLAGIVVNDSILLVEFLKLRAREGHSVLEAAKLASRERFRAVLLTSLTTIAGLIPLLSERSLQAQVLIPLATSIVFGLLASTVLVLLVVPALFSILDDWGWTSLNKAQPDILRSAGNQT